ncbi:hypothetical protein D3C77_375330 [compost metagenome]
MDDSCDKAHFLLISFGELFDLLVVIIRHLEALQPVTQAFIRLLSRHPLQPR